MWVYMHRNVHQMISKVFAIFFFSVCSDLDIPSLLSQSSLLTVGSSFLHGPVKVVSDDQ